MKTALMSLVVVAVAGVPGVASAATVTSDGATAVYRAAPREVNTLSLVASFPALTFADATASLTAGPGCVTGPPLTCPGAASVTAYLGDKADTAHVDNFWGATVIDGGDGPDDISGGAASRVTVTGGNGNDTIWVNANSNGTGDGGAGNDSLLGTSGNDNLSGGDGADLLTNRQRWNNAFLDGGDGADRLVGNSGATLTGGIGPDILVANNDGESLDGGPGADRITSVAGGSTILGGTGGDQVDAADGSGIADTVDCGPGFDVVWADAEDTLSNCELVLNGPVELYGTAQAIADAAAL
ncbi:MAG TPA: calcium-binding protein [Baekduia sp.]|nr:calcium-binding protein [Baekduia sp.]